MAFGFLANVLQGDSKPGGGVFGFLNHSIAQPVVNQASKFGNEVRALPAAVTNNQQAVHNILTPGGGFGHQGGVLGGAEQNSGAVFSNPTNIRKAAGTALTLGTSLINPLAGGTEGSIAARAITGAKVGAPLGFLSSAGNQLETGQFNPGQLAAGAVGGAVLGAAPTVAGATAKGTVNRFNAAVERQAGPRLSVPDQQVLRDWSDHLVGANPAKGRELTQLITDARAVGAKHGIDLTNGTNDSQLQAATQLLDQVGKNRAEGGFIGKAPEAPHTIETPSGTLSIGQKELDQLSQAKTPAEVKQVIGDTLPEGVTNRVAPAIALTKDPVTIKNIFTKELTPTPIADIRPPVAAAPIDNLGQSEAAKQITDTLAEAQKTRALQEQSYSAERSERIGHAQGIDPSLSGTERYKAQLAQLKGPLAKEDYTGLSGHLSPTEQESLFTKIQQEIQNHPDIQGFGEINAQTAARKVIFGEGGVPTNSELNLLKKLDPGLGQAAKEDVAAHNERLNAIQTFGQKVGQIAGLPREIMATADFSGGLRQGLAAATRHPVVFAKAFAGQFKNFASEDAYHEGEKAIYDHPDYPLLHQSGTAILELDKKLGPTEEKFISNLGEKIPVVGHLIRASNRAYTGLLNNMRANIFYDKVATLKNAGYDLNSPENFKLLKDLGKVINTSTGRGDLGRFEAAGHALSTALFAPRLIASRLSMLDPRYYINLEPPARKEALQTLLSLGAFGTGILGLADLAGGKVSKDPTNADFGKVRIGDTRIDPLGGYAQYIRLGAQLAEGKKTNSTTGATTELGKGIAASRWDVFANFLTNKEAPVPSFVTTALKGKDAAGNPVNYKKEVLSRFTPLLAQDLNDLYSHPQGGSGSNVGRIGSAVAGTFGAGLQTYSAQDNPLSTKQKTYVQNLQQTGAPQDVIKASTSFFQNLKEASGTRTNVNTAVDKAIAANDLPKAQQLAETYNKELAAGMQKWAQQNGEKYGNQDLQGAYDRQKINLTPSSIQSRIKSIKSTKPF